MHGKITTHILPERYTVKTRRYIDGQHVTGHMTATVTHTLEDYWDSWSETVVPLGYRVQIFDSLDGGTSYCTIDAKTFRDVWADQTA